MPRFFTRFNSTLDLAAADPVNIAALAAISGKEESALDEMIDAINGIQHQRAVGLRADAGESLSKLKGLKTVFLGDSISRDNLGYRVAVTRAAELDACNLAVSGAYSTMRLHDAFRHLKSFSPALVSLMLGANDSILLGEERIPAVSLAEYRRNISAMLRQAKKTGAKILLFEVTPVNEARFNGHYAKKEKFQTNENISKYNAVLQEIAQEFNVPLHSNQWLLEDPELFFEADGIHLSKDAHDVFAKKWFSAAINLL